MLAFCDAVAIKSYGGQAGESNLKPRWEVDDDVVMVWKALVDVAGVSADRITVRPTHILLNTSCEPHPMTWRERWWTISSPSSSVHQ